MPSHRTALAALLLALPAAALAQDAAPSAAPAEAPAAAAAVNEAIAEISEALDPSLDPDAASELAEVEATVRPGILAQPAYDPAAPQLVVPLVLDFAHMREIDVPFAADGFLLSPMARTLLDEVGVALAAPELAEERYLIAGHVDPSGDEGFDAWLSERRAAQVRAYLVDAHAIDPARLLTAGFGAEMPRATAAGEGARRERIEVILVEEAGDPRPLVAEPVETGNVVCDSRPVALVDPRPGRHDLDDFGSPRTPVECDDVHQTRD